MNASWAERLIGTRIALALLGGLGLCAAALAQSQPIEHQVKGPADKDIQIGTYINVKPDCTSGPLPTIRLIGPPEHGNVSVKKVNVNAMNYKQCLALEVPGYVAFYRAAMQAVFLVWLSAAAVSFAATGGPLDQPRRIVGYYGSWSAYKGVFPDEVEADYLTHFVYAFANISDTGTVVLGDPCIDAGQCGSTEYFGSEHGNFGRLQKLKERHPRLKALVAIGGWSWSKRFSDVARTQQTRERFVQSAIELLLDRWPGLFDGFDLDWEYPVGGGHSENVYRPEDRQNYTHLVAEFRRQLDRRATEYRRAFLLTLAAPAMIETMKNMEIDKIANYVDWFNVMTYDYHTASGITHFNSPLYAASKDPTPTLNVHTTIQAYLAFGVPPKKLVLGIPFFGYKYRGVAAGRNGLFQRNDGGKYVLFRELQEAAASGYRRFWHDGSRVPWFYNRKANTWVTYDDVESVAAKAEYVRRHALGGAMIWELSGDDGRLLKTVARSLKVM